MIRYTSLALTCSLVAVSLRCSCLHEAARQGNIKQVEAFVQSGADVNRAESDSPRHTPLAAALSSGPRRLYERICAVVTRQSQLAVVQTLLKAGADPNAQFGYYKTPLMSAAKSGNIDAVRLLLHAGAVPRDWNNSALHCAAYRGHTAIVKALLDAGAPVNAGSIERGGNGLLPIHMAAASGRKDVVHMLIHVGSELDMQEDVWNSTPLGNALTATYTKLDDRALRELLNRGAILPKADLVNQRTRDTLRANAYLAHQWAWTVRETLSLTSTDTGEQLPADLIRLIMSFATNNAEPREPNLPRDQLTRMRYSYTDTVSVSCAALLMSLALTAAIIALP